MIYRPNSQYSGTISQVMPNPLEQQMQLYNSLERGLVELVDRFCSYVPINRMLSEARDYLIFRPRDNPKKGRTKGHREGRRGQSNGKLVDGDNKTRRKGWQGPKYGRGWKEARTNSKD